MNPYEILGVTESSDFEDIQKARDLKVKEAGDDLIAKAKIESSFDQLLMGSLKARKSGSVSFEAKNASIKENQIFKKGAIKNPTFFNFSGTKSKASSSAKKFTLPDFLSIPFDQLPIKISLLILFLIIFILVPDSFNRLLLSLSTLILTYINIKSGRGFVSSLGWSVVFLSLGLIFGGLIETNSLVQEISSSSLSRMKIEGLPAALILWLGIIFL